jgi:oligopeptide/dipeptide ABC transporter ATP-binding protein
MRVPARETMNEEALLLDVSDLRMYYELERNVRVHALNGISFSIVPGEVLGLVGESGCGKSTAAKAILRLLGPTARIAGGEIQFRGRNLLTLAEKEMNSVRWQEISLVTQSAMNALNPVARVADQMRKTFLAHGKWDEATIFAKSCDLFEKVGLSRNRLFDFPHQFSGGMRQRVVIAMAMALSPQLIIADEPTTALDVIMQAQIIDLLRTLAREEGLAIILITHDIGIVAELCRTVGVMYAGTLVEYGEIELVFNNPYHPYTIGLKGAFPTIKDLAKSLVSIPGSPPRLSRPLEACGFADRCPLAVEICRKEVPRRVEVEKNHSVACHRRGDVPGVRKTLPRLFASRAGEGSA